MVTEPSSSVLPKRPRLSISIEDRAIGISKIAISGIGIGIRIRKILRVAQPDRVH